MRSLKSFFGDEYSIKAQMVPGVVAVLPSLASIITVFFRKQLLHEGDASILSMLQSGFVVFLLLIILFLFAKLSRAISIGVWENRLFNKGLYFPSTQLLLKCDTRLDKQYKANLIEKIEADSGLTFFSKAQEQKDEISARRHIRDAVKVVKAKTRPCIGTQRYLINYGMARNLQGALIVGLGSAIIFAVMGKIIFDSWYWTIIEGSIGIIYAIPLFWSAQIIKAEGFRYAEKMFEDYANLEPNNHANSR